MSGAAPYSSSLTSSPHAAVAPSSSTCRIARWAMKRVAAAPCQVSMLAGLEEHAIAWPDHLDGGTASLGVSDPFQHVDRLTLGVRVPVGTGAGCEVGVGHAHARDVRRRRHGVHVDGTREPLARPSVRLDGVPRDLHAVGSSREESSAIDVDLRTSRRPRLRFPRSRSRAPLRASRPSWREDRGPARTWSRVRRCRRRARRPILAERSMRS